jgi:hypothetical protein
MSLFQRLDEQKFTPAMLAAKKLDRENNGTSYNDYEITRMRLQGDAKFEKLRRAALNSIRDAVKALKRVESYGGAGLAAYDNPENLYAASFQREANKLLGEIKKPVKFKPVGGWKQAPELAKVWPK